MWRGIVGTDWTQAEQHFKTVREGLLIIALVVGGIWALIHFSLSDSNAAKARLDRLISGNKAIGLQAKLDVKSTMAEKCVLIGQVSLQNYWPDKVDVQIDLQPSIEISPVEFVGDGFFVKLGPSQKIWINDIGGIIREPATVVPGRTVTLPFAAQLAKPGLYMVRFKAPVTRVDDDKLTDDQRRNLPNPTPLRPKPENYSYIKAVNQWSERQIVDACPRGETRGVTTKPNTSQSTPVTGSDDAL